MLSVCHVQTVFVSHNVRGSVELPHHRGHLWLTVRATSSFRSLCGCAFRSFVQRDAEVIKIDIKVVVHGDVVMECVHVEAEDSPGETRRHAPRSYDQEQKQRQGQGPGRKGHKGDDSVYSEHMMFRIAFNTNYARSNMLILTRDSMDILWDEKDRFARNFKVEVRAYLLVLPSFTAFLRRV